MGWPLLDDRGRGSRRRDRHARAAGERARLRTSSSPPATRTSRSSSTPRSRWSTPCRTRCSTRPASRRSSASRRSAFVDYLTLVGDSVDNVPGVEKVGPKTAVKWLQQYGTLDNVVAHAGEIGGVVGENLRKALDWLPKARELLTIKCDVPLAGDARRPGAARRRHGEARRAVRALRIQVLARDLEGQAACRASQASSRPQPPSDATTPGRAAPSARTTKPCSPKAQLDAWLEANRGAPSWSSVDTETTSLDPMKAQLVGISFAVERRATRRMCRSAHRYAGAPAQLDREATSSRG